MTVATLLGEQRKASKFDFTGPHGWNKMKLVDVGENSVSFVGTLAVRVEPLTAADFPNL